MQGEYVTDVRFEFGTVPSGFSSVVKPTMRVQVLGTVSNGYQIINRADVGGQYLNEWQTAKTTWVTTAAAEDRILISREVVSYNPRQPRSLRFGADLLNMRRVLS